MQWFGLILTLLLTVPIAIECAAEAWSEYHPSSASQSLKTQQS